MPLLIDGHNLIGAGVFADIKLTDEDDEAKLVARLKVWRSRYKGKMTVIFDRGIAGGRDHKLGGAGVEVIFARNPTQADDLIRRRIRSNSTDWIVVTNDDELVREAQRYGKTYWRGDEFVRRFALDDPVIDDPGAQADIQVTGQEIDEWLQIFAPKPRAKRTKPKSKRPPTRDDAKGIGASTKKNRRKS